MSDVSECCATERVAGRHRVGLHRQKKAVQCRRHAHAVAARL